MSKLSKKSKPAVTSSSISVNGQNKANTVNNKGHISTNYNMSDTEKYLYDYAGNALKDGISSVNILSPDVQKDMQAQINAYTKKGIDDINSIYTPMINSAKNDIASRFGNLDNTPFLSKLNSIEANRANAANEFAQDIMSKRNELVSDELQKRYSFLNFMNNIQNQITNNAMKYINSSQAAATGKSYNTESDSAFDFNSYLQLAGNAVSAIGMFM